MRRILFVAMLAGALVVAMGAPALAHVCFVSAKPAGAGSAGTATLTVNVDVVTGDEEVIFTPGPDLKVNPKNGRVIGGFATTTVTLNLFAAGTPIGTQVATRDLLFQNTVGGHAHFAGPGDSGCDGVGIDSLEECFLGGP